MAAAEARSSTGTRLSSWLPGRGSAASKTHERDSIATEVTVFEPRHELEDRPGWRDKKRGPHRAGVVGMGGMEVGDTDNELQHMEGENERKLYTWKARLRARIAASCCYEIWKGGKDDADKALVDRRNFQLFISMLIGINMVTVGIETDLNHEEYWKYFFGLINLFLLMVYTMEIIAVYLEKGLKILQSNLMKLDLLVVGICMIDRLASPDARMRALISVRFVRVIQLARSFGSLELSKEVNALLLGSRHICATVLWVALVMSMVLFTAAAICTSIIGESGEWNENLDPLDVNAPFTSFDNALYFGDLSSSALSLMQAVTVSQWADNVARPVVEVYPLVFLFTFFFCFATSYGLLCSIVAGMVQNSISSAKATEKAQNLLARETREELSYKVIDLIAMFDMNADGELTADELNAALERGDGVLHQILEDLGVPKMDGENLVRVFDTSGDGKISYDEFREGIVAMDEDIAPRDYTLLGFRAFMLLQKAQYMSYRIENINETIMLISTRFQEAFQAVDAFLVDRQDNSTWRDLEKKIRSGAEVGGVTFGELTRKKKIILEPNVAQHLVAFTQRTFPEISQKAHLPKNHRRGGAAGTSPNVLKAKVREAWPESPDSPLRQVARGPGADMQPMLLKDAQIEAAQRERGIERDRYAYLYPFDSVPQKSVKWVREAGL